MTVEVTQAVSRNDADEIAVGPFMDRYLDGSSFSDDRRELTQAFARHRLAAVRIKALERELAATKEKEARLREALDIADRLIERGYGIDVPPEWDRAFRRCLPHSAALSDG
jgi:hypothetical protein